LIQVFPTSQGGKTLIVNDVRIGMDIDGVLADFLTPFYAEIKRVSGEDLFHDGQIRFNKHLDYPGNFKAFSDEIIKGMFERSPLFWMGVQPLDRSTMAYVAQVSREIPMYFISNRVSQFHDHKNVIFQTKAWLASFGIMPAGVILTNCKDAVCWTIGLTYFIEDRLKNYRRIDEYGGSTECYLLDKPYNRVFDRNNNRIREYDDVAPDRRISSVITFLKIAELEHERRKLSVEG